MKPIERVNTNLLNTIQSSHLSRLSKGVFIVCWLPFFVMALILTLMPDLDVPKLLLSFILWLGYANSLLNPVIYTIFSPDFRNAFRRMLFGRKANRR